MNKRPSEFTQQLNRESPPESPAALDKKIIDYAKARAAATVDDKQYRGLQWLPIVATMSVAFIAVLLVVQQSVPKTDIASVAEFSEQNWNKSAVLERKVFDSEEGYSGERLRDKSDKKEGDSEAPAVSGDKVDQPAIARAIAAKPVLSAPEVLSSQVSPPPAGLSLSKRKASKEAQLQQAQLQQAQKRGISLEENIVAPLTEKAEKKIAVAPSSLSQLIAAEEDVVANADDIRLDIDKELSALQQLIDKGMTRQAEKDYQLLKKQCPDCKLPEVLKQALLEWRARQPTE